MADLIIRNLTKLFPRTEQPAVDALDIEIREGELVALLGPSGCGKSTTLRMIAGLESVSEGEILIGGRNVVDVHPKDRGIGLAFENYALYPPMTVRENLGFNLTASGMDTEERNERIERISRILSIEDILEHKPRSLSSGQKQRVNIARAMVRYPSVLLLDEPLSHLDPRLRARMRSEIKRIHTEMRFTTVLVTHDQMEAMALADRIAVLNNGKLQQYAEPVEVFNKPANEFVASFLGEPPMNLLTLSLSSDQSCLELPGTDFSLKLTRSMRERIGSRACVRFGVRPQDIHVLDMPVDGRLNLSAAISVVENLGEASHLGLRFAGELFLVHCPYRSDRSPGERVVCSFEESKVSLFPVDQACSAGNASF